MADQWFTSPDWSGHAELSRADGSTEVFAGISLMHLRNKFQNRIIDEDGTWERVPLSAFHIAREEDLARKASRGAD